MKKIFACLLICVLMLSLVACGDNAADNKEDTSGADNGTTESTPANNEKEDNKSLTVDDVKNAPVTDESLFRVTDVEGGVAITGFTGKDEIVVIPETINGKTVVVIGGSSFVNKDFIRGIKIADTVRTVSKSAFVNCFGLEVAVMGKGVKLLDQTSFSMCNNLKTVELNDGLEEISRAFICENLKELEIPSSVTKLLMPVTGFKAEKFVIIGETGSYAEQYVKEKGEKEKLVFQAK